MTDTDATDRPGPNEQRAAAIAALTALARTSDDGARMDFADALAGILASVTANVGHIEQLLAGRSGSWEADLVRQLVCGTVGWEEQYLPERRTEPIVVWLDVEAILEDRLGDAWHEGWTRLEDEVSEAYDAAYETACQDHAGDPHLAAAGDVEAMNAALTGADITAGADAFARLRAEQDWLESVDPTLAQLRATLTALEAARRHHERAYARALLDVMTRMVREAGYTVPVETTTDWPGYDDDEIARQIEEAAAGVVPLPVVPDTLTVALCEHASLAEQTDGTYCASCHTTVPAGWTETIDDVDDEDQR
jgi:hypothetical protein